MANNITVLDGSGNPQDVKTTDTAGVHTPHHNVDSSALPTGAATAAKQPALGTAGSASTDVITVQGIAAMTPVLVTLSGTNNIATVTTVSTVSAVTAVCGQTFTFGAGSVAAGTPRVTLASDDPAVAKLGTIDSDTSSLVGCVSGTEVQVDIVGSLPAGTNGIGKLTANSGVTIGGVELVTVTAGGESSHSALSTAAVYTAEVKGSAGQVYSIDIFNKGASPVYVRLYNQTGAPASGDGANIIWRGTVPGSTSGAGFVKAWPNGKAFGTGIGIRVSGAIADNDTTALAANEVSMNVGYK